MVTHTYTHDNYSNPRCAHAHRGLIRKKERKFEGPTVQKHSILLLDTLTQHAK